MNRAWNIELDVSDGGGAGDDARIIAATVPGTKWFCCHSQQEACVSNG